MRTSCKVNALGMSPLPRTVPVTLFKLLWDDESQREMLPPTVVLLWSFSASTKLVPKDVKKKWVNRHEYVYFHSENSRDCSVFNPKNYELSFLLVEPRKLYNWATVACPRFPSVRYKNNCMNQKCQSKREHGPLHGFTSEGGSNTVAVSPLPPPHPVHYDSSVNSI